MMLVHDRVDFRFACPYCREQRIDRLVWQDDDTVTCATCGTNYAPDTSPLPSPARVPTDTPTTETE